MSGAFDALMQLGEALNKIIERFSKLAIAAHGKLYPVAFDLIALLCMIDLCLSIIMAGFEINPNTLFVKVLRYGFIYWVFVAWPTIVELFYQSLVISVNQTVNPDQFAVAADNICQPHLLLQKVIYLIKPGFDYMSSLSNWQVFKSMLSGGVMMLVVCGLLSIVVMILYILFAVYMSYVYISFFVYTALSTITLPFMSSKFVKFFTEGAVGAAWTAMIRLMVMTFLLGMMTVIFAGAGFENAKGLAAGANTADTVQLIKGNFEICTWYMTQCVTLSIFAVFMVKITDNICGKLGGRFEIGL